MNTLEKIFLGEGNNTDTELGFRTFAESKSKGFSIINHTVETQIDQDGGFGRSWINLEINNHSSAAGEYKTEFTLPDGCFISNYYLYVGETKKFGMVADKRAANYVYQQIVNDNKFRDPGIVYFASENQIAFKVSF